MSVKRLSFLFFFFLLSGEFLSAFASDSLLEIESEGSPSSHQTLETFLEECEGVLDESLWPFFKKSWTAIFEGYQKLATNKQSFARLTAKREREHTECLLETLRNFENDCEMQFLTIITRLNSPTHLQCLSQDLFFDENKIFLIKSFEEEFLDLKEDEILGCETFNILTNIQTE